MGSEGRKRGMDGASLSEEDIEKIRTTKRAVPIRRLSKEYGVTQNCIRKIWGLKETDKHDMGGEISHEEHMKSKREDKEWRKNKLVGDGSEYLPRLNRSL